MSNSEDGNEPGQGWDTFVEHEVTGGDRESPPGNITRKTGDATGRRNRRVIGGQRVTGERATQTDRE